jgi:hypothetical protein
MTAPAIIRQQREDALKEFEGTLQQLTGVQKEHLDALRAASTSSLGNPTYPKVDDLTGVAAYQAAALAALAAALYEAQNPE